LSPYPSKQAHPRGLEVCRWSMAGPSRSPVVTPTVGSVADSYIVIARCGLGLQHGIQRATPIGFGKLLTPVPENPSMTPEFYLVLRNREADDTLADAVYDAWV